MLSAFHNHFKSIITSLPENSIYRACRKQQPVDYPAKLFQWDLSRFAFLCSFCPGAFPNAKGAELEVILSQIKYIRDKRNASSHYDLECTSSMTDQGAWNLLFQASNLVDICVDFKDIKVKRNELAAVLNQITMSRCRPGGAPVSSRVGFALLRYGIHLMNIHVAEGALRLDESTMLPETYWMGHEPNEEADDPELQHLEAELRRLRRKKEIQSEIERLKAGEGEDRV